MREAIKQFGSQSHGRQAGTGTQGGRGRERSRGTTSGSVGPPPQRRQPSGAKDDVMSVSDGGDDPEDEPAKDELQVLTDAAALARRKVEGLERIAAEVRTGIPNFDGLLLGAKAELDTCTAALRDKRPPARRYVRAVKEFEKLKAARLEMDRKCAEASALLLEYQEERGRRLVKEREAEVELEAVQDRVGREAGSRSLALQFLTGAIVQLGSVPAAARAKNLEAALHEVWKSLLETVTVLGGEESAQSARAAAFGLIPQGTGPPEPAPQIPAPQQQPQQPLPQRQVLPLPSVPGTLAGQSQAAVVALPAPATPVLGAPVHHRIGTPHKGAQCVSQDSAPQDPAAVALTDTGRCGRSSGGAGTRAPQRP